LRPGLLECRCGQPLSGLNAASAGRIELDLVRLLKAKFDDPSLRGYRSAAGIPVSHLAELSFDDFATLLFLLGQHFGKLSTPEALAAPNKLAVSAGMALRRWPHGFHESLRILGDAESHEQDDLKQIRQAFGALYRALTQRHSPRSDTSFIKTEFEQFLSLRFSRKVLGHARLGAANKVLPIKSMSIDSICARFALSHKQLEGWCRLRNVDSASISREDLLDFVTETQILADLRIQSDRKVSKRRAAAILGLPVTVLDGLASLGCIGSQETNRPTPAIARSDIERLSYRLEQIGKPVHPESVKAQDHVSLSRLLETTCFWSQLGKAELVLDILQGRIKPFGRLGSSNQQLFFDRTIIGEYVANKRDVLTANLITVFEASEIIGCKSEAVEGLISLGYLEKNEGPYYRCLDRSQVMGLATTYVTLGTLAKEIGTLPRVLRRQAKADGLDVLSLKCSRGLLTDFILRDEAAEFLRRIEISRREVAKIREHRQVSVSRAKKLERYLYRMRKTGTPLPRKGRKLVHRTIAQEAGIDRGLLYSCQKAKALLASFDEEDATEHGIDRRTDLEILAEELEAIAEIKGDTSIMAEWANLGKKEICRRLSISRNLFYTTKDAGRVFEDFQRKARASSSSGLCNAN